MLSVGGGIDMENKPCKISDWKYRTKEGYATNGKEFAHRAAYEKVYGKVSRQFYICHSCDNPPCIEITHLWKGTPADNCRDKRNKGKQPFGTQIHCAKLTEKLVKEIKAKLTLGAKIRDLGKEYNVTYGLIGHIKQRRKWKHV
jgi:hypothetical protein